MPSRSLTLLLLTACAGGEVVDTDTDLDTDVTADTDPCTDLTWETVGAPFATTWCTPCHATAVTGDDRQGAPESVNLDTYESVLALASSVRGVATGPRPIMPPGGGPTDDERARLADWLDCETR